MFAELWDTNSFKKVNVCCAVNFKKVNVCCAVNFKKVNTYKSSRKLVWVQYNQHTLVINIHVNIFDSITEVINPWPPVL